MSNFGAANWEFEPYRVSEMKQSGTTQRAYFEDEDILLVESLVREVIQNSTDAALNPKDPVVVTFDLVTLVEGDADSARSVLSGLDPHFKACGIKVPDSTEGIRVLVIEDFNTVGLTGAIDDHDDGNFAGFWRSIGLTEKKGISGGRYGLGKIVFPSSSKISTFFGLSWRSEDKDPLLLGRANLMPHKIEEGGKIKALNEYAFWFSDRSDAGAQLPIRDNNFVLKFRKLFRVNRWERPGLSVVAPFVRDEITKEAILKAVLNHYYFPVMDGKLEVKVCGQVVDQNSFKELSQEYCRDDVPFDFLSEASDALKMEGSHAMAKSNLNMARLSEDSFDPSELADMRIRFAAHEQIHVKAPVVLTRSEGESLESFVDVIVQKSTADEKSFTTFVRGSLTIPGESKAHAVRKAKGALVAKDTAIATFLGDAENPAHIKWIANGPRFMDRWDSSRVKILMNVRHSLQDLVMVLEAQERKVSKVSLIDTFYLDIADPSGPGRSGPRRGSGKRGMKRSGSERVGRSSTPRGPDPFDLNASTGGFVVTPSIDVSKCRFPAKIRLMVAYQKPSGRAFDEKDDYEFRMTERNIVFDARNMRVSIKNSGKMKYRVIEAVADSDDFFLQVSGFDVHRAIVVDYTYGAADAS